MLRAMVPRPSDRPDPSKQPPDGQPSALGEVLGGRYRVTGELGRGAMGVVFAAVDQGSGREVALKLLVGEASARARARLEREGAVTGALCHPGIVGLLDSGDSERGPYLVYELIPDARPWSQLLPQMERERRLELFEQVVAAVAHAHANEVVHRDLKPENVLIDGRGRARVVDFGLGYQAEAQTLTQSGTFMGTPLYMAPEQISASTRGREATSDVWALGVLLYLCLTNRAPFQGGDLVELSRAVCSGSYPPSRSLDPTIPEALEQVIARCLRLEPAARLADACALERALALARSRAHRRRLGPGVGLSLGLLAVGGAASYGALLLARGAHAAGAAPSPLATLAEGFPASEPSPSAEPTPEPPPEPGDGVPISAPPGLEARTDALIGAKRYEETLALLDAQLRAAPADLWSLARRAHVRGLLHDTFGELADYQRMVQVAPGLGQAWFNLANVQSRLGALSEACAAYDRAVALGHVGALYNRGNLHAGREEYPAAIADYTAYLERRPANSSALHNRGVAYLSAGDPERAVADLEASLREGRSTSYLIAFGQALHAAGRLEGARRAYDEALAANPRDGRALLRRGELSLAQGDIPGALQDLEQARVNDGGAPVAAPLARARAANRDRDGALRLLDWVIENLGKAPPAGAVLTERQQLEQRRLQAQAATWRALRAELAPEEGR
ncbi:MAG: protein kinase [Planctomycetota bacterium]